MKVSDIMTKDVVIADKNDSILNVAKLMEHHNIGCIPVVENGQKVLGVITDRDIVLNLAKYNFDLENTTAKELASEVVYKVKPDADARHALELMKKVRVRRLPVMDDEFLVGMLSLGDVAVYGNDEIEVAEALIEISKPAKVENIDG